MSRVVYTTRLTELNQVTPTMKELKIQIEGPQKMPFKAGQFVMLQVPVEGKDKPAQRAYSIASTSHWDDHFNLLIKHVPGGLASEYVAKLQVGDTLNFTGPWGKCVFLTPAAEQVLFVCTGSGLSQHFSFLTSEAQKYPKTRYHMIIGVGTESEVFYLKELENAKAQVPNFNYEYIISRPSPEWKGRKGYVTQYLSDFDYLKTPTHIYLCGIDAMIKGAKKILIEENGFPKDCLVSENFG